MTTFALRTFTYWFSFAPYLNGKGELIEDDFSLVSFKSSTKFNSKAEAQAAIDKFNLKTRYPDLTIESIAPSPFPEKIK